MSYKLCSLSFETSPEYEANLQTLTKLIEEQSEKTLIVAPEVCLSGFDYENLEAVLAFSLKAMQTLCSLSHNKIIILTMLERREGEVFNFAKVFHNGRVVYERAKARLFRFGDEHKFMSEGSDEVFKIIEIEQIKIAILICFELRFKELWQKAEGADVIAIPSWWGVLRSEHFRSLTQSLAIINQCYVVASDSANQECTKLSGIITPQGIEERNEERSSLTQEYSKKEIKLMRRYMDVGITSN